MPITFIFAAPHHNICLRSDDVNSYTPSMFGTAFTCLVPLEPRSCSMEYAASWKFATMLAFGFVAAILLGML